MAGINITNHGLAQNDYFYLEGDLYKILQMVRASDYVTAWNYHKNGVEEFTISSLRQRAEPAFRTKDVAEMVNRSSITVRDIYQSGVIPRPKKTYPLNGTNEPLLYSPIFWSKEDVYRLHDALMERHNISKVVKEGVKDSGRKDIPTRAELRASLEHGTVYYVKDNKTGKMVKVWKAESL